MANASNFHTTSPELQLQRIKSSSKTSLQNDSAEIQYFGVWNLKIRPKYFLPLRKSIKGNVIRLENTIPPIAPKIESFATSFPK